MNLRTLQLQLEEGRFLPVQIHRETVERSVHSGRDLVELHGWVVTGDAQLHQRLSTLLPAAVDRAVRAEDEAGEFAGKWCVSWNSYAESTGIHTYSLILREAEELSLEALVVDGMEIRPYEYREEVVGDGLTVWAKVVGTREDVRRLRGLVREGGGFPVVRRGIQEEPREMRLGVAEWSEFEDRIKYRLVLVDRALDGSARPELLRIEEENSRAALGFYANFLERLADAMVEKGVLSRAELSALREAARTQPGVSRHELWRVADVDEL